MKKANRKVMVFGTFDIFHKGHESFLKQARRKGDFVIVVVARDKTVLDVKKQESTNNEQKRLGILKNSGLADKVILGSLSDKYLTIKRYKPDVICLGYDQKAFTADLTKKLKKFHLDKTTTIRLKSYYPNRYKSSKLR